MKTNKSERKSKKWLCKSCVRVESLKVCKSPLPCVSLV